jgi:16S rRNA (cytosine1402-N4)-methyltransferase
VTHTRRPRYSGKNPRGFHEKYKELNPDRYASEVQKVLASGKTPAGMHRPIMVEEILECLRPMPGETAADCTLGGGGHARAILDRVLPGGRLIGLDVDPIELPRTEAAMRSAGYGPDVVTTHHSNFAGLPQALVAAGLHRVNLIVVDLGVSSMQLDNPERGFSHKLAGPLDMRMNPGRGTTAAQLITRMSEADLATLLEENSDEPDAAFIAGLLKQEVSSGTTHTTALIDTAIRKGLIAADPRLTREDTTASVRRTFQALRIAVNDEFSALDALLRVLPTCLEPGGRVAILSFHSGEDRRVKKAFQSGERDGTYSEVVPDVIRATMEEVRANPRSSSAKLRWAVRA